MIWDLLDSLADSLADTNLFLRYLTSDVLLD